MEPVFRALEIVGATVVRATGTEITYRGLGNIPAVGGAVVAINHTGYVDFLPAALAVKQRHRRLRFMIKAEMQQVSVVNFLILHTKTIPVHREAGGPAYTVAVQRLREGELVAVYPEATISRSFELKDFKTGAVRMAGEARVPIVPMVVWGTQRIWTKDHRRSLRRGGTPVTVAVGAALPPRSDSGAARDAGEYGRALRESMTALLHEVQMDYPHEPGAYWVPRRLGGSAPTPAEADRLDVAELAERARRRAQPHTKDG